MGSTQQDKTHRVNVFDVEGYLPAAQPSHVRSGLLYGIVAYGWWGLVPLYFKSLSCSAKEIVAHRVLWSAVFLAIVITVLRRWTEFWGDIRSRKVLLMLFTSAYLVAANWYVYVYATMIGQITQASLGYFILPLVNVIAGITIFGDRLRPSQILALTIAAVGVVYLTISLGQLPWIGLFLAVSFAFYGVVRKVVPVDGIIGLSVETVLLAPTAIVLLIIWERNGELTFAHGNPSMDALIAFSGVVTTIPLICFAQAVRRVSLVTIGVLQYLSPTLQLILGVAVYGENFSLDHQVSFGLIWAGLAIYVIDALRSRSATPEPEPVPEPIDGGVPLTESQLVSTSRQSPHAPEANS
jgi:chloramphenicol-sensitive protein RarD